MAETGKKAVQPPAESPPANQAVDAEAVAAVQNELPKTVEESSKATKRVSTQWPTNEFHVEGLPVIRDTGSMLTAGQVKEAEEAAARSGVSLTVEDAN